MHENFLKCSDEIRDGGTKDHEMSPMWECQCFSRILADRLKDEEQVQNKEEGLPCHDLLVLLLLADAVV